MLHQVFPVLNHFDLAHITYTQSPCLEDWCCVINRLWSASVCTWPTDKQRINTGHVVTNDSSPLPHWLFIMEIWIDKLNEIIFCMYYCTVSTGGIIKHLLINWLIGKSCWCNFFVSQLVTWFTVGTTGHSTSPFSCEISINKHWFSNQLWLLWVNRVAFR